MELSEINQETVIFINYDSSEGKQILVGQKAWFKDLPVCKQLNEYGAYACLVFGVLGFIFSGLLTRRYEELKSKLMKYEYSVPKKD